MKAKIMINPNWRDKEYKEVALVGVIQIYKQLKFNKCYLILATHNANLGFEMTEEEADEYIKEMYDENKVDLSHLICNL